MNDAWIQAARAVIKEDDPASALLRPFWELVAFQERQGWYGACHADTAVLYVLGRELGVAHITPIIGEASYETFPFDHSWLDVNGHIWDAAAYRPLPDAFPLPVHGPIVANVDVATGDPTPITYGSNLRDYYRPAAQGVLGLSFVDYLSNYPRYKSGLWGVIKELGEKVGLHPNISRLKQQYADTAWTNRRPHSATDFRNPTSLAQD